MYCFLFHDICIRCLGEEVHEVTYPTAPVSRKGNYLLSGISYIPYKVPYVTLKV